MTPKPSAAENIRAVRCHGPRPRRRPSPHFDRARSLPASRCTCSATPSLGPRLARKEGNVMLEEFKKFALRGNVVDLAVGVMIGAALGRIVESVVGDLFMPMVGAITGSLDFLELLRAAVERGSPPRRWWKPRSRVQFSPGATSSRSRSISSYRLDPVSRRQGHGTGCAGREDNKLDAWGSRTSCRREAAAEIWDILASQRSA